MQPQQQQPEYYREPWQRRAAPDISEADPMRMQLALLNCSNQERSSKTAQRFLQAYQLLDDLDVTLSSNIPIDDETGEYKITYLAADPQYMKACVNIIEAVKLTDMRVGVAEHQVHAFPMPSCWSYVTLLKALDTIGEETIQLGQVGAKSFVVLLTTAIVLALKGLDQFSLQLVHELFLNTENEYDWLNWDDLQQDPVTSKLNKAYLRFVLATVGIKGARKLYRNREQRSSSLPGQPPPSSKFLLDSMETFANDQVRFMPESATGFWNLGYIAHESCAKRGVDPLEGAAECMHWMEECYKVADTEDDDFRKAEARIEAAVCLILGGGGMIGYKLPNGESVMVKRNFRQLANQSSNIGDRALQVIAGTVASRRAVVDKEKSRMARGVRTTFIEPGETLLIARWEVLKLWNEAMVSYDSIARWGHHFNVYGETSGWHVVVDFLERTQNLAFNQFANGPTSNPGFNCGRDQGQTCCTKCGKVDESHMKCMRCSRCKVTTYCSRECQVADWKRHKPTCKPS